MLLQTLRDTTAAHVVITHGTDTMLQTAQSLQPLATCKTLVITGAMRPERFANTDAHFNVGCALGAALSQPPGVYVCMNGVTRRWDKCERDMDSGRYVDKAC